MTNNQLRLAQLKEEQRHNLIYEKEVARHNLAEESLSGKSIAEAQRSNLAREAETHRSNVMSEMNSDRNRVTQYETAIMNRLPLASIVANPMTLEMFEHLLSLVTGQTLKEGESYANMKTSRSLINAIINMFLPEDIDLWDGSIPADIQGFIRRAIYGNKDLDDEQKQTLEHAINDAKAYVEDTDPDKVKAEVIQYRKRNGISTSQKPFTKAQSEGKEIGLRP